MYWGPTLLQYHPIVTNYNCKGLVSKSGHILRDRDLGFQHVFFGGHNSTHKRDQNNNEVTSQINKQLHLESLPQRRGTWNCEKKGLKEKVPSQETQRRHPPEWVINLRHYGRIELARLRGRCGEKAARAPSTQRHLEGRVRQNFWSRVGTSEQYDPSAESKGQVGEVRLEM